MPRAAIRLAVTWFVAAGSLLALAAILPGLEIDSVPAAFAASAVAGVLNALLWPLIIRLALPLTVLTLGLFVLVLNGAMILLVAAITPGVEVNDLVSGIAVALGATAITTLVGAALSIDEDPRVARHLRQRALRRAEAAQETEVPGLLFLEIDGLAYEVLQRAMRDGNAPAMARWLREGTHHFARWETDWSSQTGACQAGLLHGSNDDMPAFRWWEKDRGQPIVTNHPRDAAELERRRSDGRGLLHAGGASRANILSGDATHSLLTMSTVLDVRRGKIGADYYAYFSSPYNVSRTLLLALAEIVRERRAAGQQRRRDVHPRIHRGWSYAVMRAWATIVQRDLQVETVVADVYAGRPVVYTTFLAYDEVAHHSGIERPDTLAVLRAVDHEIERIADATRHAPRPYEVVVLADHGQAQGATFLQRYGLSLDDLVREACDTEDVRADDSGEDEARGRLAAALTEAAQAPTPAGRAIQGATRGRTVDGEVRLDEPDEEGVPEVSVMASGNLGLITFPRIPGRATLEQVQSAYPRLIETLRTHPGIAFVLVDGVVLGAQGTRRLADASVEGEDPLAPFGPHAAHHVARTNGFPHCPDILVNSTYWEETGEVAAFEELVGSHGGMGGSQAYPFLLVPDALPVPETEMVGAERVHQLFRRWLVQLGHPQYGPGGAQAAEGATSGSP
jgi:uncharacterized membrane protein YvlD (DUF360 family)